MKRRPAKPTKFVVEDFNVQGSFLGCFKRSLADEFRRLAVCQRGHDLDWSRQCCRDVERDWPSEDRDFGMSQFFQALF